MTSIKDLATRFPRVKREEHKSQADRTHDLRLSEHCADHYPAEDKADCRFCLNRQGPESLRRMFPI